MDNAYEQMKNRFLLELDKVGPGFVSADQFDIIGKCIDRAAFDFDVTTKQTALVPAPDPIPMLVKTYIVVKRTEGLSDGTLSNYARSLKYFFLWVRKQPQDVTANDIRMYLYEYKQQRQISDRTLDKLREYICWFFTWAHTEEYIPRNPGRSVKGIKYEQKERSALTQIELEYLRMACETPREKAILEFLYSTGCRVSELVGVKMSDIDWRNRSVHLFGKGRKHRTSYLNAKCDVALSEYVSGRAWHSEYLFASDRQPHGKLSKDTIEATIREIAARSKVTKHITPHVIRHTTATQAVNNGMAIEDVSKLLGHASVATTMIYAKVSDESVKNKHVKCVI